MFMQGINIGITNIILFLIVVIARRIIHKEGINNFLVRKKDLKWKLFFEGLLIAFILIQVYVFFTIIFKRGNLTCDLKMTFEFFITSLSYVFAFAAVSLFEESLFRDYILLKFIKKYSRVKAIFLSSLLFSFIHIFAYSNTGSLTIIALFNAFIIGVILSLIVFETRSIMWVLGFHLGWNLTQTMFLTINTGGFNLEIQEGIIAGTAQIPEAGIIVSLVLIILIVYMLKRFNCKNILPKIEGKG